jgi:cytochrome c-type biogenesis protein
MNGLMQQADLMGLGAALVTGFLFSFNPATFVTIPVVLAYVTKARALREAITLGAAFIAGMIITHLVLGIGAAIGGEWAESFLDRRWNVLLGAVLVLLGLVWTGWLKFPLPWFSIRGQRVATVWGAFVLGIPFTVGICPVCSPGLWVVLSASAASGSAPYGALLLLAFATGRTLPVLVGAFGMGWLESLKSLQRWHHYFELLGGLTLIIIGLYLLNEYFLLSEVLFNVSNR